MKPSSSLSITRVVFIYVGFASLWILLSDRAVGLLFSRPEHLIMVSTIKGWLFVIVTALLLYGLLKLYQRQQDEAALAVQAEQDKRQQLQTLLNNIVNTSTDAIFAKDLQGRYLLYNPHAEKFIGKSQDQVLGKDDSVIFPPEQARQVMENDQKIIATGQISTFEETLQTAQGTRTFLASKGPLVDTEGKLIGIFGISRDITAMTQTNDALKLSEARLRALIDTIPDLVWLKDPEGHFLACNAAFERLLSARESELVGKTDDDFVEPAQAEMIRADDLATIETGVARRHEEWVTYADDGHRALLDTTKSPVYALDGKLIGVLGIGHDITELKHAAALLQESEERLRLFIDHVPAALAMFDREMRYIAVSHRWKTDFQLDDVDLIGRSHYEVFPEIPARWIEIHQRGLAGEIISRDEDRFVRENGDIQWLRWEVRPWRNANNEIGGIVIFSEDISARKNAEEALRLSEQRLRLSTEQAGVAVWEHHVAEGRTDRSANHDGLFGLELQENWDVECFLSALHPDDREFGLQMATQIFSRDNRDNYSFDFRVVWPDKSVHWLSVTAQIVERNNENEPLQIRGCLFDITTRKEAEEHLRLAASVVTNTSEAVIVTDPEANIVDVNPAFTQITGYSREEVLGQNPRLLQSGRQDQRFYQTMWRSLNETGQWRGELWNRRKDGSLFPVWQNISIVADSTGQLTNYVSVCSDISQIKNSQEKLDHLAHHDALTDLPNRVLLNGLMEKAINQAERHKKQFAVLVLDLDHFKNVNDSLGHSIGDELLQIVARELVDGIRVNDTVARIGGDEFVLLLEELDIAEDIGVSAEKLVAMFMQPIELKNHEIQVSASIGISIYPRDGLDPDTLLRNADAAMYRAKEKGRNNYQFYTEQLTINVLERLTLQNSLRHAQTRDQFSLVYQPQLDLQNHRVIGCEALLRWQHPGLGAVSPIKFIPLAEESGLIHPIGEWVLRTACEQAVTWLQQGVEFGRVSVNIAGPQLQHGKLVNIVSSVLAETGLSASHLELEVTEGFIMLQAESTISQLNELREMGVTLAIDDFGTGYSSLSYLKELPIHKLKIDQSFVRDIPHDANDVAISNAIIAMGNSLGLTVIAEGVETLEQANFLRDAGCAEAQGYYYSRPVSVEDFARFTPPTVAS